jgi:hypothetical protein
VYATGANDIPDGTEQHDCADGVGSVHPDGHHSVHWAAAIRISIRISIRINSITSNSRTTQQTRGRAQAQQQTRPVFGWRREVEEEKRDERTLDVSRVKVTPISVSTASKAQNSHEYLFMGQLEELKVPTLGGTRQSSAYRSADAVGR